MQKLSVLTIATKKALRQMSLAEINSKYKKIAKQKVKQSLLNAGERILYISITFAVKNHFLEMSFEVRYVVDSTAISKTRHR